MTEDERRPIAGYVIGAVGLLLTAGFAPTLFNRVAFYDDEGFFVMVNRAFLGGGDLYTEVGSAYGPFYHSFVGGLYRLSGQDPTLTSGRIIVLAFTAASAVVFAMAVWRVTRSLGASVLCEVATFSVLIPFAGGEPLHPGSLIVLLLALLCYAVAGYSVDQHPRYLAAAGALVGALLMTKVNVGLLAAAALAIGLVVGNEQLGRRLRAGVAVAALVSPLALIAQRIYEVGWVTLAAAVGLSLLALYATLSVDMVSIAPRSVVIAVIGMGGAMILSLLWPILAGTSPSDLLTGVFLRPLEQADNLSGGLAYRIGWIGGMIAVGGAWAALAHRPADRPDPSGSEGLALLALSGFAIWLIGQAVGQPVLAGGFARWLPAIAVLPALAWIGGAAPASRMALRFLTPLVVLQTLHVYPVPGSQQAWGTVAVIVPCSIALAAGIERNEVWIKAKAAQRGAAFGALCLVVLLAVGLWPVTTWRNYANLEPLDLPGAELVRVDRGTRSSLHGITDAVKDNCDTFYAAPGFGSLYVYSELPPPTGFLRNWPGAHSESEQRRIGEQLARATSSGQRVCIVRDEERRREWKNSDYGSGPLGAALAGYERVVARVGRYSVSVEGEREGA